MTTSKRIYQFRVILEDTQPMVWRRIIVPASYTFWALHVAIQDAMGWLDYHLHVFNMPNPKTGTIDRIGIPLESEFEDATPVLPGWEITLAEYFGERGDRTRYEYDFGDGWIHDVVLEKISKPTRSAHYPTCIDGARACPPEDCGGPFGFEDLLAALVDPNDERYAELRDWVGADYDPAHFNCSAVEFDDPDVRWRNAFARQTDARDTH